MRARLKRLLLRVWPVLALLHVYIGAQLLPSYGPAARFAGAMLLGLSALLIPLGFLRAPRAGLRPARPPRGSRKLGAALRFLVSHLRSGDAWDKAAWAGFFALGLFSTTLVLTVLRELALLLPATGHWARPSAIAVPAAALLVSLVGLFNARRVARVVDVRVEIPELPPGLDGFTIVQISDIHVGPTIKAPKVRAIVERVNSLQPDLVAITGDVVDGAVERLREHTAPLGELRARHGAWLVTGNHEYYSGAGPWLAEFERLGLRCLLDTHVVVSHDGAEFVLAGVTDPHGQAFDPGHRSDPFQALEGSPPGLPRILLAHQPRSSQLAARAGFDLQLSGHTHGGQFWPWNHFVGLQQPFTAGLHRVEQLQVYVSRGTGYWGPPKRFGAPSEITRVRLAARGSRP